MNLPSVLDNIIDLFKPKGESVLGIDFGGSSIKVVQAKSKAGRPVLETYGEIALGPYADMEIGRVVKLQIPKIVEATNDVLREASTTTKVCGTAIPLSSSIITTMKIPQVSGNNIEEIVSMEARRYIPVSMSEINLDWQVIPEVFSSMVSAPLSPGTTSVVPGGANVAPTETSNKVSAVKYSDVLIVAVYTEAINHIMEISKEAGLDCKFFEIEAFSAMRALLNHSLKPVAMVDLGASSSKIYISYGGIIRASHVVPFGSQDITMSIARAKSVSVGEAEIIKRGESSAVVLNEEDFSKIVLGGVSYIINEVKKFIREYQTKNTQVIEELVITGGGAIVAGVEQAFAQSFEIKTRLADPFANLMAPAFLTDVLKKIGPSFSVAVGAVLRALEEHR